jgi:hypothetical protein
MKNFEMFCNLKENVITERFLVFGRFFILFKIGTLKKWETHPSKEKAGLVSIFFFVEISQYALVAPQQRREKNF